MIRRCATILALAALSACGGSKGGADGEFCTLIRAYETDNADFGGIFSNPDATDAEIKAGLDELVAAVGRLRDAAPDDVRADVETVTGTIEKMAEVLAQYDYDFDALATAPEAAELQTLLASDDVALAGSRLDAYTTDVCGVSDN